MLDIRSALKLPEGLASFNNVELYYIISKLFGLGGFGEHFIEKERLYICFEKQCCLQFLFITTIPIISESQTDPETTIYYGEFDEDFEEIEIYGGTVPFSLFRGDKGNIGNGYKISELLNTSARQFVRPRYLVEGLLGIVTNTDIRTREANNTFLLSRESQVPGTFKLDLSLFAPLENRKEFSGTYFLVAEPIEPFESDADIRGTLVHEYIVNEDQENDIELTSHPISDKQMKMIEDRNARFLILH
jgi:hypothetical protein